MSEAAEWHLLDAVFDPGARNSWEERGAERHDGRAHIRVAGGEVESG
jgi:hypothetical protein